ncbi:hypothetical protein KAR91_79610 [Candidatus Pacearchaeota archaeon]|nr:hypothetical protein [Candidatus Pacearchaeota archaeon]
MKVLKPEYQVLADEYADTYGCSCHINPPCSYCTHEGNPDNLENIDEAWEEVPDE